MDFESFTYRKSVTFFFLVKQRGFSLSTQFDDGLLVQYQDASSSKTGTVRVTEWKARKLKFGTSFHSNGSSVNMHRNMPFYCKL